MKHCALWGTGGKEDKSGTRGFHGRLDIAALLHQQPAAPSSISPSIQSNDIWSNPIESPFTLISFWGHI